MSAVVLLPVWMLADDLGHQSGDTRGPRLVLNLWSGDTNGTNHLMKDQGNSLQWIHTGHAMKCQGEDPR